MRTVFSTLAAILRLKHDRSGNFTLTLALCLPILLAAGGFAIDATRMVNTKLQLQDGLDAAALSAASSLNNNHSNLTDIKTYALNVLLTNMSNSLSTTELASLQKTASITATPGGSGNDKSYTIVANGAVTLKLTGFSSFLGFKQATIRGTSTSQSQSQGKTAMSMFVVLDRSGSMSFQTTTTSKTETTCQNYTEQSYLSYYPNLAKTSPCHTNKMGALKAAAATLFDQLDAFEDADKTNTLVRAGAVSFNDAMQTPQNLDWGTSAARTYVNALPAYPDGGTDMTEAMATAYAALVNSDEAKAQSNKNNSDFSKFILLMTDGENTGASPNWNESLDTETRQTCADARAAGITIYTVAFMAPEKGQSMLLNCAGSSDNYYEADDMTGLVAAFKEIGEKAAEKTTRLLN